MSAITNALKGFFKGTAKVAGGATKLGMRALGGIGGAIIDGVKKLTKGKEKVIDTKIKSTEADTKNELKKLDNTGPEPDKLAEQDKRAAESEVQASKVTESKVKKNQGTAKSLSNKTKTILQGYGLSGELIKSLNSDKKDESQNKAGARVYSRSDIYNIYQQKAPVINIDKAVRMLAANNEILSNVNETIRLIHEQGVVEAEFKKVKSEKAKVLSEKAKDDANSLNNMTDKSGQKLAEMKAQAAAIRDALHDDLTKSGDTDKYLAKMLELMAHQQIAQSKEKDEDSGFGLAGGLLSLIPAVLSMLPNELFKKPLEWGAKLFNKGKSMVSSAFDGVKNFFGFGSKSADAAKAVGSAASSSAAKVEAKAGSKAANEGVKKFMKKLTPQQLKVVKKKLLAKVLAKEGLKLAGKKGSKVIAKKVPIAGLIAGLGFGISRLWSDKDYEGAVLEIASGLASCFPGVGTAISAGLDVAGIARDVDNLIDDLEEGNIENDLLDQDELSELLVEPSGQEIELSEAQDKNSEKENKKDILFSAIGGPLGGLRRIYRELRKNDIIKGDHPILDSLAGHKTNEELKQQIEERNKKPRTFDGGGGSFGSTPTPTAPAHIEAKSLTKSMKGVSTVKSSRGGSGEDGELSDSGGNFSLSPEGEKLMQYWQEHQAAPTDAEAAQKLVDYWKSYEGKLDYSQVTRDVNKGSTDCSGMVMNSMKNLFGMNISDGSGYCAASFATNKVGSIVTHSDVDKDGNGSGKITQEMIDRLQPGDVIYTRLDKWKGQRPFAIGHASLYIGNGKCLSQGGSKKPFGGKGPYEVPLSSYDGKYFIFVSKLISFSISSIALCSTK